MVGSVHRAGRNFRQQAMSAEPAKIAVVGSLHYDIMLRTPHLPRLGETLMGNDWWWKRPES